MYPYVFVVGLNKHDVLVVSHVPTKREILTEWTMPSSVTRSGGDRGVYIVYC